MENYHNHTQFCIYIFLRQELNVFIWQVIINHHRTPPYTEPSEKLSHDDFMKWTHFSRYWPIVRRIHRSPVDYPHQGQGCGALMFSLKCAWTNGWANNRDAGDLRHHRAHYDVILMAMIKIWLFAMTNILIKVPSKHTSDEWMFIDNVSGHC